jgi:hypothetical protein
LGIRASFGVWIREISKTGKPYFFG